MLKSHQFENENSLSQEANDDASDVLETVLKIDSVKDKSFNEVHWRIALDYAIDQDKTDALQKLHAMLTSDMADTLAKIASEGPIEDGDVPSKSARDELSDMGMVDRVAIKGEFGQWAATGLGFYLWNAAQGSDE
ncbi:MAG: hypothetical protein CL582_06025 [Alteromonadaceae bacterium]|nr:hypothetical protein [Alteromonadaceae bacterium]|tara:strand:+ start:2989 stop:3393 length:405 start_codon:yes stop_codon:yes gene_type:complete